MGGQLDTTSKETFMTGTPVPQTGSERLVVDTEQTVWVLGRLSGEGRIASEGAEVPCSLGRRPCWKVPTFRTGTPVPQTGSERFVVVDAEQTVWVLGRLSKEGRITLASEGAEAPGSLERWPRCWKGSEGFCCC